MFFRLERDVVVRCYHPADRRGTERQRVRLSPDRRRISRRSAADDRRRRRSIRVHPSPTRAQSPRADTTMLRRNSEEQRRLQREPKDLLIHFLVLPFSFPKVRGEKGETKEVTPATAFSEK
jgi:hypothetical protein